MRRTTASCCASLRPKYARHGPTIENSFATTVVTPSKWPGRLAPHSPSVSPSTCTVVRAPVGYISATVGMNSTSTPSALGDRGVALEIARVRAEVLGRARTAWGSRTGSRRRGRAQPRARAHQRAVPFVEEAHRGDEADRLARARGRRRTRRATSAIVSTMIIGRHRPTRALQQIADGGIVAAARGAAPARRARGTPRCSSSGSTSRWRGDGVDVAARARAR